MRILHVITSLRIGGAEKLMVDLLPRLKEKGHQVDLLLFDGVDTQFKSQLQGCGVNIISCGMGRSVYHPANILKLRKLMTQYDVIHTHNYAPQIYAAIASIGKSVRLVTTEHASSNRRRKYRWFSMIDRWMYRRYSTVICIADKTLENLKDFVGNNVADMLVINNGVDVNRFASANPSAELEKLAPKSRKIIMVAGFRWEKDQDTIIRALNLLPDRFHLFLVGDGVRRAELEKLANVENVSKRVHFMGIKSNVPELLHAADYVVMSSHFEGLSLSSVEGMSVGKPFLASDVDGLREVATNVGVLFPHQDAQALAKAIIQLELSPTEYEKVSMACFKHAAMYDISLMAEQYNNVYLN